MNTLRDSKLLLLPFLLAFALFISPAAQSKESSLLDGNEVSTIIQLHENIEVTQEKAEEIAKNYGGELTHVYEVVLNGFAMNIPQEQLTSLLKDSNVSTVSLNRTVQLIQPKNNEESDEQPAQNVPRGVKRIGGDEVPSDHEHGDVNVAVVDTGIDRDHPDLKANVEGGASFVNDDESNFNDGNGHGSHVAGTIAGVDNDIGVIGVAPKANLFASKVLDKFGRGSFAGVIDGIDWVANTDKHPPIQVANMSLGGRAPEGEDPTHKAIKNATKAGVRFAVAAGNSSNNVKEHIPARYPEVITVSALDASDDSFASFSNYGEGVQVIAPGVNVQSTYKGGNYRKLSGTSMASPHTAGTMALAIGHNEDLSIEDLTELLQEEGEDVELPEDPDDTNEPLIDASEAADGRQTGDNSEAVPSVSN